MGITKRRLDMTLREWAANNGIKDCEICGLCIEECTCPEWEELLEGEDKNSLDEQESLK